MLVKHHTQKIVKIGFDNDLEEFTLSLNYMSDEQLQNLSQELWESVCDKEQGLEEEYADCTYTICDGDSYPTAFAEFRPSSEYRRIQEELEILKKKQEYVNKYV